MTLFRHEIPHSTFVLATRLNSKDHLVSNRQAILIQYEKSFSLILMPKTQFYILETIPDCVTFRFFKFSFIG